jgi:mannobiose 2-epimerase
VFVENTDGRGQKATGRLHVLVGERGGAITKQIAESRSQLEKLLTENIIPFWYPGTVDRECGGYKLNHDGEGKYLGKANKALVTQARTVWFFSRLMRTRFAKAEYLEVARHGFRFLRDAMWDVDHGGFYWSVDHEGKKPVTACKHLYGQAFGLYALSEYARASGDREAMELARRIFHMLEERAHDGISGGYSEWFERDWTPATKDTQRAMWVPSPDTRLMNTHLHLMEAFTSYYDVTRDPVARERLAELIRILSNSVVRKSVGACTDKYRPDWTPLTGEKYDVVSYGHDVENVWLVADACRAAGTPAGPYRDLFRTLFDYSLRHGFDEKEGGFYDAGPFSAPATRRAKNWWVQCEGLVGALYMYTLTGDERYSSCYLKTLDWIVGKQADWKGGDWHATILPDGTVRGHKAGAWKSPYHNGRAAIRCMEIIDSLRPCGCARP